MMPMPRPLGDAGNALPVLQVRVHARRRIEEPGARELRGVRRVFLTARKVVGQAERQDRAGQVAKMIVIADLVDLRIPLAILADVRTPVRL